MNLTKPQKLIYDMDRFAGGAISVICGSMLVKGEQDLDKLKWAVNELYRLNDALRIRIRQEDGQASQQIIDYTQREVEVLRFDSKAELDTYAEEYAKVPIDLFGDLCSISIVLLPGQYGVLVKFHHMVGDAWTIALIGTQFNKLLGGEAVESYSYADYIDSEQAYLQSSRYEKDRAFFLEQFQKCDEVTYLNEKQSDTRNACRRTFVVNFEQTRQIVDYAKEHGTSAFVLFTAVLATYMSRIKMNAEKFYIGTAVLNRSGVKEKNTMGMFVNTVPMLMELDNSKSFAENLDGLQKTAFSIFRHQKHNYGDVLAAIRKEYGFSETLYDVMISYQNAAIVGAEVETTWYFSGSQNESLQVHIDDRDSEGIFRIHYDYLTDKFTENEIDMLHRHICTLLFDAIQNDEKTLPELELLTAEEKQKLLYDFNDTAVDYPQDKCVHQLFEEQVLKTPDKTAIIACDKTLTYAQLNEEANRIAHALIAQGVGVGDIVAFALQRKSYLISAILGILKTGAAYLPIDPDYPQERIDYMLQDSSAKLFVTEDNLSDFLGNFNTTNPNVDMFNESLCYCIYTSGSTAKPKGVLIRHRNLINFCHISSRNKYQETALHRKRPLLSTFNPAFDGFGVDWALFLLNGCSFVFVEGAALLSPSIHKALSVENDTGVIQSTPSMVEMLSQHEDYYEVLARSQVILFAAEDLPKAEVKSISKWTNAKIFNGYGPTECTIGACFGEVSDTDIHIGKPIANTQIYIVDQYLQPTPIGVTGELCIAGDGVGAGYLNRPELTAEKFIDNPFGKGKLYKTGDLSYWREDGNIVYVGRNDFQVKIRGLRIELGEIEHAICGIGGISQSVVVVRKNSQGRQLICAFYVGTETDAKDIRAHIGKKLPKYMLPHICTRIEEMPLTSSGKVNRKALPEVDLYAVDSAVEYVPPTTELEHVLISAVKATLGIDRVGVLDNFFDVGGDSLKAVELISELEKRGYYTDIKTIFACDTVEDLAAKLTVAKGHEESHGYSGDIPATDAQMRVYTAQSMHSGNTSYNVPYVFKVDAVDIGRLQDAVNQMMARHESLRTHFENKDGTTIQVVDDYATCEVEILDSEDVAAFIRSFDLSKAPLLRVGVYGTTIMVDMHHIITDGGSMPIFFKELNELYMGRQLNSTPVQYRQFALEHRDHSESEEYWLSIYNDEVPVLEINTDYHRVQKQSFSGAAVYDALDMTLHKKILAFCKEQNITPYVFYMSGFNILLSKFSGNEDIVVGMPISGRETKYIDTIGMFVNTVALRSKPAGTKTVSEFLWEVKENSINAITHQSYPYNELVKKLNVHTPNRNPLFDVMFAYQSEQMTDVVFGDKKAELLPVPVTTAKYDFTFHVMPRERDVVIMAEYCTTLYKEQTVQRLICGYKQILQQLLCGNYQLRDLSALTAADTQKLLFDFNNTAVDYPKDRCVHQMFEEQVEAHSNRTAVVFKNVVLSYADLAEIVQEYADKLVSCGIQANDVVAIHLERSHKLIAFQLAVLKIGAVFLPVDKRYPMDRIEYMCTDCNVKLFISDKLDNSTIKANVIALDKLESIVTDSRAETANKQGVCYIIYTSGSTGNPKGCMLTNQGLFNFCKNNNTLETLKQQDSCVFACVNSASFDYFIAESLLPLTNGFTTVVLDDNESTNQERFLAIVEQNGVNVVMTTPTRLKIYYADKEDCHALEQLQCICTSGEPLTPDLLVQMYEKSPKAQIYNPLGPSECSVWVVGGKMETTN